MTPMYIVLETYYELWGPPHHAHMQIKRLGVLGNHPGHSGDLWVDQSRPQAAPQKTV